MTPPFTCDCRAVWQAFVAAWLAPKVPSMNGGPFGLAGIIWSLTVSEGLVLIVGLGMLLAFRRSIERGLAEGSPERAEATLQEAAA